MIDGALEGIRSLGPWGFTAAMFALSLYLSGIFKE